VRRARLEEDVARIRDVYNAAWTGNWGFAPMTDREATALGRRLARFGEERLVLIAEVGPETVGFALALPDWNEVLARLDGRLWSVGMVRALWHARRITRARLVALGVRPAYRLRGIEAVLVHEMLAAVAALGYVRAEVGWTLADNDAANHLLASCGWRRVKSYRLYERPILA
jgi:GNAT superfamily N-acetyltransferase